MLLLGADGALYFMPTKGAPELYVPLFFLFLSVMTAGLFGLLAGLVHGVFVLFSRIKRYRKHNVAR